MTYLCEQDLVKYLKVVGASWARLKPKPLLNKSGWSLEFEVIRWSKLIDKAVNILQDGLLSSRLTEFSSLNMPSV